MFCWFAFGAEFKVAFRFLWLSASFDFRGHKEHLVVVPIAPVLVYSIYLSPFLSYLF
jgi:hypothetical protein